MVKIDMAFLLISKVCPQGVVCPCRGVIDIYKIIKNVYKIRFLFLNLQQMGKVIRAFCWHQKIVPKGLYALALGLYTYKIRFQRDHFEICNIWAKRKGLSAVVKILSPICCLPLLYTWGKPWKKMCLKSDFKEKNLQQMGKVKMAFCWHQHLSPRGCLPLPKGYIHL